MSWVNSKREFGFSKLKVLGNESAELELVEEFAFQNQEKQKRRRLAFAKELLSNGEKKKERTNWLATRSGLSKIWRSQRGRRIGPAKEACFPNVENAKRAAN